MFFQSSTTRVAVRRATPADIDWIVSELREFAAFYNTKKPLFPNDAHARNVILLLVESHVVFVAERGTELLGFIGGMITPHIFNPEIRSLGELFWWVAKEHRGSRAGLLLLNEFVAWGEANADWITIALENNSPAHDKCLTRRGFRAQERSYLREVV